VFDCHLHDTKSQQRQAVKAQITGQVTKSPMNGYFPSSIGITHLKMNLKNFE